MTAFLPSCSGDENYSLAVGMIRGVRAWDVQPTGRLKSVAREYWWSPGNNTSVCDNTYDYAYTEHGYTLRKSKTGRCGRYACGCGFWAYHDGTVHPSGNIYGVIDAWGKTTIGSKGFRAEHAKVVALCSSRPLPVPKRVVMQGYLFTSLMPTLFALINLVTGVMSALLAWLCILAFMTGLWSALLLRRRLASDKATTEMITNMREQYPNAKFYTSYRKMLRDFQPSYKLGDLEPLEDPYL